MYFGKDFFKKLYAMVGKIYIGKDIERQGGTKFASAIKYFLAVDEFKKKNGKAFDTRNQTEKALFVKYVGDVVQLGEKSDKGTFHTKNFSQSFGYEDDFKIGSNFYSAGFVDDSLKAHDIKQISPKKNPLLSALNGVVDIMENSYNIFETEYLNSSIKNNAVLFLWLSRFKSFSSKDNLYNDCLEYLKLSYTTALINSLRWESNELKSTVTSILESADFEGKPVFIQESDLIQSKTVLFTDTIPFPLNRIIFGAPGTGKSHCLNDDAEKYFEYGLDIKEQLIAEIKNRPQDKDKEPWFNHIGIKYASYIYKRCDEETEGNLQLQWGVSQNELWKMKTAARATIDYNHSVFNTSMESVKRYERVTFHPNYSYAQFVGTYKPTMTVKETGSSLTNEQEQILKILLDNKKTSQEKYDFLFKTDINKSDLIALVGLATGDDIHTKEKDGTPRDSDHTGALRIGKKLREYAELKKLGGSSEIAYEYVPGPFMRVYAAAKQNPSQNFLLLIEEINRANVAAVFGDVFQLLDRDENGNSEYPVAASEDIKKYLAKNGIHEDELRVPSNMYIWATMNSADQGVFPMDTAFKRRWEFEYIGIDDGAGEIEGVTIPVPNDTKKENDKIITNYVHVEWNKLRVAINDQLKKVSGVNEDKLLGPFFIGDKAKIEKAAEDKEQFCKSFKSKVLMYLFEDVVKMQPGELFESKDGTNIHYSDICKDFDALGLRIFVKSIYDQFPEFKNGDAE